MPESWWIPVTWILVIIGSFIAAIADGCNLGHGMVGVSLLSLGSISSTAAIVVGVFLADRGLKMWAKAKG